MKHTPEELREALRYEDGKLYWLRRRGIHTSWNSKYAGKRAGSTNPNSSGYITVCVDSKCYQAHRVAWAIVHGEWPSGHLDHINQDKIDNRVENLRVCTHAQNQANNAGYKKTTGLPKGVTKRHNKESYRARIRVGGKGISLGEFTTPEEAHAAYCKAADEHFGEFASYG